MKRREENHQCVGQSWHKLLFHPPSNPNLYGWDHNYRFPHLIVGTFKREYVGYIKARLLLSLNQAPGNILDCFSKTACGAKTAWSTCCDVEVLILIYHSLASELGCNIALHDGCGYGKHRRGLEKGKKTYLDLQDRRHHDPFQNQLSDSIALLDCVKKWYSTRQPVTFTIIP